MNVGGVPWTEQRDPKLKDGFRNVILLCVAMLLFVLLCFIVPAIYARVAAWRRKRDVRRSWSLNRKSILRKTLGGEDRGGYLRLWGNKGPYCSTMVHALFFSHVWNIWFGSYGLIDCFLTSGIMFILLTSFGLIQDALFPDSDHQFFLTFHLRSVKRWNLCSWRLASCVVTIFFPIFPFLSFFYHFNYCTWSL